MKTCFKLNFKIDNFFIFFTGFMKSFKEGIRQFICGLNSTICSKGVFPFKYCFPGNGQGLNKS